MMFNRLLGLVTDGPSVLLTLAAASMVSAPLPPPMQMGLWSTGVVVLVLLRAGFGEGATTRILGRCRAAGPAEAALLRPLFDRLTDIGGPALVVYVASTGGATPGPVAAYGRRSVVVTSAFLEDLGQGQIGASAATRTIAQVEAWRASGSPEWDLVLRLMRLPGRWAAGCASPLVRPVLSLPPVLAVWRLRWVVALVAVGDSAHQGHAAAGLMAAVVIATSYLSPAAKRARQRRRTLAASALMGEPEPRRPTRLTGADMAPEDAVSVPSVPIVKRERHLTVVR